VIAPFTKNRRSCNMEIGKGFLEKLFVILETPQYSDLIAWQPDGQSFLIKEPGEFSTKVLPHHYKHSNYQSFVRQLNMYSFNKSKHDASIHEFHHSSYYFTKNDKSKLHKITRKGSNTNNNGNGRAGSPAMKVSHRKKSSSLDSNSHISSTCSHDGSPDMKYEYYRCSCELEVRELQAKVRYLEDAINTINAFNSNSNSKPPQLQLQVQHHHHHQQHQQQIYDIENGGEHKDSTDWSTGSSTSSHVSSGNGIAGLDLIVQAAKEHQHHHHHQLNEKLDFQTESTGGDSPHTTTTTTSNDDGNIIDIPQKLHDINTSNTTSSINTNSTNGSNGSNSVRTTRNSSLNSLQSPNKRFREYRSDALV